MRGIFQVALGFIKSEITRLMELGPRIGRTKRKRWNSWNPEGVPNWNRGVEMDSMAGSLGNDKQKSEDTFP